ncbi:MAG: CBS domain-containing protein [Candidatus Nitrosocaldus sp.]|nr:CBS domain-containing protein [Candidatus Nitrosocaldus sp.]MDW8000636.1 CBS domain-containing protein [Candidatus Nitrosocaldus sp.]
MLPRLEYIKQARIRLGLTQRRLATLAGVSTSMINQIESGRCKPSYDTAKRIFEVLNSLEDRSSPKVVDICTREIIGVSVDDSLHHAIELMRRNSFSQLPVFADSKPVGMVSEEGIVRYIMARDNNTLAGDGRLVTSVLNRTDHAFRRGRGKGLNECRVRDIMEPAPPIVDASTPAKAIVPLIRFSKCVLVSEKGNIVGIVTVADMFKIL